MSDAKLIQWLKEAGEYAEALNHGDSEDAVVFDIKKDGLWLSASHKFQIHGDIRVSWADLEMSTENPVITAARQAVEQARANYKSDEELDVMFKGYVRKSLDE